jgi:adenylate cyclase class 2
MKTEIEAKFLNVDFDEIRQRLVGLGAVCEQPMRLMRRTLLDVHRRTPEENYSSFLRLRDEGDKVTLTLKEFREKSLTGASEREVIVSDFDETKTILEEIGVKFTTFQESKRETWHIDGGEVVLDEWPWIPRYIEVEGPTEETVKDIAAKLGFNWDDAVFGSVDVIYGMEFPDRTVRGVIDIDEVRFGDPIPEAFIGKKA